MNLGRSGYDNVSQGPSPTGFPPPSPEVPATEEMGKGIGIDTRIYEGKDTTEVFEEDTSILRTPFKFLKSLFDYVAPAQNPELPVPDPEGEPALSLTGFTNRTRHQILFRPR